MSRLIILALFFGSGLTSLAYQVVWTKLLTFVFGVTLLAVSTVLTCFFGGLALGSYLGGRWIDRRGSGFKWYGVAEALIGAYALVFALLLNLNNSAYVFIAQRAALDFFGLSILKFVLAAVLLIVPTTLMGATLPILSRTLAGSRATFARDVGGLYAINTFGAVAGAVLTAFVFIPSFGLSTILYSAAVLNLFIGGVAIYMGRFYPDPPVHASDEGPAGSPVHAGGEGSPPATPVAGGAGGDAEAPMSATFTRILVLGFAVSGFTGLAYEVIWTRVLGFMLTGTVYAFAAVLAVFLSGIAVGSLVFSSFIDRFKSRGRLITILAVVEILIGLSSMALIGLYDKIPSFGFYAKMGYTQSWSEFVYLNFFTAFITLIIPTFLFGATFPLVCKIYSWRVERVGTRIGNIYSLNTVGGILGSFIGGFFMVPFIGMQNTIVVVGCINIAIGLVLLLLNPFAAMRARYAYIAVSVAAAVVVVWTLPVNMPYSLHKGLLDEKEESILFYKEGATATVMISERTGMALTASNKRLWINGNRATAAFYEGLQINRFQGVLPMVIHPDPKDVLVICFGSGTTFGTLSQFPVNMVDNVEIAGTVIEGAEYFKSENMDVLNNPKSRITIDDGRSFLSVTTRKFDVITEEPMHPALVGVINLYTKEYYELAKAHLKEGGIMSQWIPLYNLSVEDVRALVKTFQSVFPHTSVWLVNADIFMIGAPEKTYVDFTRLKEKLSMPNVKRLLTAIDLEDPYEFLSTFIMSEEVTRRYTEGAQVMTDDMPVVEFTGPKSLNVNTISSNIGEFIAYREPVLKYLTIDAGEDREFIRRRLSTKFASGKYNLIGRAYFADRNYRKAVGYFREALKIDPADRNSIHYLENIRPF
jgi:spermidine synthase